MKALWNIVIDFAFSKYILRICMLLLSSSYLLRVLQFGAFCLSQTWCCSTWGWTGSWSIKAAWTRASPNCILACLRLFFRASHSLCNHGNLPILVISVHSVEPCSGSHGYCLFPGTALQSLQACVFVIRHELLCLQPILSCTRHMTVIFSSRFAYRSSCYLIKVSSIDYCTQVECKPVWTLCC